MAQAAGWSRRARTSSTSAASRRGPATTRSSADEERARVVPVIAAVRPRCRTSPISVDTTKPAIAEAALAAGADLINDVWGVGDDDSLARLAADHGVPLVVMHNRAEPVTGRSCRSSSPTSSEPSIARPGWASRGTTSSSIPGSGSARRPITTWSCCASSRRCACSGRPILLGTSRKSTLGRVLDLPAEERLEATLATTALGIAAGVDIVRVHDVEANVRAARMTDAVVRGPGDRRAAEGGHP